MNNTGRISADAQEPAQEQVLSLFTLPLRCQGRRREAIIQGNRQERRK